MRTLHVLLGFAVLSSAVGASAQQTPPGSVNFTREVALLPGGPGEPASLPGPLSALDPKKDFDPEVLRTVAARRAMAEARREFADRMAAALKAENRWLLKDLAWTELPGDGDKVRLQLQAGFESMPTGPVNEGNRKAQEKLLGMFDKVRLIVAYDLATAEADAAKPLIDRINGELLRGPWASMPHTVLEKGEDPRRLAARLDRDADMIIRVTVNETCLKREVFGDTVYRSRGGLSLAVYRRTDVGWTLVHQAAMSNNPGDEKLTGSKTEFLEDGGKGSAREAAGSLFTLLGDRLLAGGQLYDACNRAFVEHFKSGR